MVSQFRHMDPKTIKTNPMLSSKIQKGTKIIECKIHYVQGGTHISSRYFTVAAALHPCLWHTPVSGRSVL